MINYGREWMSYTPGLVYLKNRWLLYYGGADKSRGGYSFLGFIKQRS